ncbi:MAG: RNA polymerase factor sigma-54 [Gemmatimonadetes bacterium]|nr:RNA polymerase factor sigma-54 [Gemmatimonadota bacterium]MBI3566854.1 RNA polymerase factor sigma-54 [Gemmatimonadota bacterium]
MRTGLNQSVRLGQELKINPRLYQAMDMLYMPLLDLQQHLKQELLVNPFLELSEEDEEELSESQEDGEEQETEAEAGEIDIESVGEEPIADDVPEKTSEDETDWEEILLDGFDTPGGMREETDHGEHFEAVPVAATHLDDHLREQVQMLDLGPRQLALAEEFIGNIGDDGYLATTLDDILLGINASIEKAAEAAGRDTDDLPYYTMPEAEAMLVIIQRLDPPGVGARDLRECLLLQLRDKEMTGSLAERLVRDFFEELVAHRWGDVARRTGVTPLEVQHAADVISHLSPKPGTAVSSGSDNYVMPDLIVEKVAGEYLVFTNDGNLPRLKLSKVYQEIARDKKKFDAENKEFISNKLNAAQWLIQAIEQRRQTMLKVMHFIVDRQREFFEKGVQYLKPLTLREVADVIGMHESTVSRVTNEKYAQTPRGVLPLKFFFSSGLATVDGDDVSARGIKATIEKLVSDEDTRDPLTDQAIVEILERDGIKIARRTVAKYRDQLGVLSARMRKRV